MLRRVRAAWLLLAVMAMSGCRLADPPPFHPRELQQMQREHAEEVAPRPMPPLPEESPFDPHDPLLPPLAPDLPEEPEPTVRMSLQEVVQRAVANSHDVRVAGYTPAIAQTQVIEARAFFDPVFFTTAGFERRERQTSGTAFPDPLNPFATIFIDEERAETLTLQSGVRQPLVTGGEVELRYQLQRTDLRPERFAINPAYENDLVAQITQPLLRNFGGEVNRARIDIARNNQRISMLNFRRALEENVAEIEQVYWQLVLSEWDVAIQEELLEHAIDTEDLLTHRVILDVPKLPLAQARSAVESRRAALVRARARIRDLSDQLKRLINDPRFPVSGAELLLPANVPIEEPLRFDLADQINTAMEYRPELAQQQIEVDSAAIRSRVARNNLLPQLNFVGSVGVQGLGEDWEEGLRRQTDFDFVSYAIGLQLEIPIGNRAARAINQRFLLQRQQAVDQYRSLVDQIALEVKLSVRDVETSYHEMMAARQVKFAADEALEVFNELWDVGQLRREPTNVQLRLDLQGRLAEAQRAEINAVINYNLAISRLERAKGTLLKYNNIVMQEQPWPFMSR